MKTIDEYMLLTRPEFQDACAPFMGEFTRSMGGVHPVEQRQPGGMALHVVQVAAKALELNQDYQDRDVIEACLAHDVKHWKLLPLSECQKTAVKATMGLPWKIWRNTPWYRFIALILIADMWSAYVNTHNREK